MRMGMENKGGSFLCLSWVSLSLFLFSVCGAALFIQLLVGIGVAPNEGREQEGLQQQGGQIVLENCHFMIFLLSC